MRENLVRVKDIILKKLKADFRILRVVDVVVREDNDSDGSKILLIDVVFEGESKTIDAKTLTGAVRELRPALIENDEDAFPIFSFIAERELGALTREAR